MKLRIVAKGLASWRERFVESIVEVAGSKIPNWYVRDSESVVTDRSSKVPLHETCHFLDEPINQSMQDDPLIEQKTEVHNIVTQASEIAVEKPSWCCVEPSIPSQYHSAEQLIDPSLTCNVVGRPSSQGSDSGCTSTRSIWARSSRWFGRQIRSGSPG